MTTVYITNIAPSTSEQQILDFVAYAGEVSSIKLETEGSHQKATVTFEKPSAASTAAMLSGGAIDGSNVEIKLANNVQDQASAVGQEAKEGAQAAGKQAQSAVNQAGEKVQSAADQAKSSLNQKLGQEDKPRTAIIAELLGSGYALGDHVIQRGIDFDKQHGYSETFKSYLQGLDRTLGERLAKAPAAAPTDATRDAAADQPATSAGSNPSFVGQVQAQAQAVLQHPSIKSRIDYIYKSLEPYYTSAVNHPRIKEFYATAEKTVTDVHEQARHIADQKKAAHQSS